MLALTYRVKSGNFGHQVNSDIHLQTVEIQMRRLLMSPQHCEPTPKSFKTGLKMNEDSHKLIIASITRIPQLNIGVPISHKYCLSFH